MNPYTIGVSRRFFPGFKKYKVVGHRIEVFMDVPLGGVKKDGTRWGEWQKNGFPKFERVGINPRLLLKQREDSDDFVIIGDIMHKNWRTYPDYNQRNDPAPVQELRPQPVEEETTEDAPA